MYANNYVTVSWKTIPNHTCINLRNTNYKYSIQHISGMTLHKCNYFSLSTTQWIASELPTILDNFLTNTSSDHYGVWLVGGGGGEPQSSRLNTHQ